MKRFSTLSAAVLAGAASLLGAATSPMITNVEPPYWWTGMANDTLQIMVTGPDIARAEVSVDYPGVRLCEQTALESPNYKLLYFVIFCRFLIDYSIINLFSQFLGYCSCFRLNRYRIIDSRCNCINNIIRTVRFGCTVCYSSLHIGFISKRFCRFL